MRWTVIEQGGKPLTLGPSAILNAPGGTIGRSPDNHLVLPDEQRKISRLQATVRYEASGQVVLRNMSAVLPIDVNGHTLQHGDEAPVELGHRIGIGSYVLEIQDPSATSSLTGGPLGAAATLADAMPPPSSSLDSPALGAFEAANPAAGGVSDVFADLFGDGMRPIGAPHPGPGETPAPARAMRPATPAPPPPAAPTLPPSPLAPPAPASPVVPAPAPAQMPSAADWDAILADAPRRAQPAPEPMPDPMGVEPFALPSQASRNPVDPLAEIQPGHAGDVKPPESRHDIDPLALFSADSSSPSPLTDPRPSALTDDTPLHDVHPATALLNPEPAIRTHAQADRAHAVSSQFRPPTPIPLPTNSEAAAHRDVAPTAAPAAKSTPPAAPIAPPNEAFVAPPAVTAAPNSPVQSAQPPSTASAPVVTAPAPTPAPTFAPPPAAASTRPAASTAGGESPDALYMAFLEGAGVADVAGQQPFDLETMRRLGRLLRAFTDGTVDLLSSRAMLKREVRAEITMIVDEENNPFKILPNGRAVLMQMFGARMPGFLNPEAAVSDALADLHSHQLGMVAGMRAALLMVLDRFNPEALKRETPHDGSLTEKLLPGGRDARLWRQLQKLHTETASAVQDDFQAVFGRAFQQAYDKEVERLRDAQRA